MEESLKALGGKTTTNQKSNKLTVYADSCCQTCTAGPDLIAALGCPETALAPTSHSINGITEAKVQILGTLPLKISLNNRTTRQLVYISENVNGTFLSQKALMDLGLIPTNFPQPPDTCQANACMTSESSECICPRRGPTPERPDSLPFQPTEENIPLFQQWFLSEFKSSAFNTCEEQPLQTMTGTPVDIKFKENAKPHAVHTAIPVAHHFKRKVKQGLDNDVKLHVIEPVPQGSVSRHCSRMVVTSKKNGEPRRTVDFQRVNQSTLREVHHTPSPFNLVSTVPAQTKKTVLDAWNGYHSLMLNPDHKDATTFITEWGRYRYCRAPMGLHTSGDAYTRRFDDITSDCERKVRCIDDTLLWDDSIETAFWHTFDYIKLCADNGIVFNKEKFEFAKDVVEFAGFEITKDGFRPPARIIDAIKNFPKPEKVTDIRSWFGLVNQVAYTFSQAEIMEPFRELLSGKKRVWSWDETLTDVFNKSKEAIVAQIREGVHNFSINRATCLATDWSKTGIGFTLSQKHCQCRGPANPGCGEGHWKLVYVGSRFLKDAETRYAPIEGEALAVAYALEKCKMFVLGCPDLTIATDHQPLLNILNDRALETIHNPRLSQLKQKTLRYSFRVVHVPGKSNCGPDFTSRYPVTDSSSPLIEESSTRVCASFQAKQVPAVTWEDIKDAAVSDAECVTLIDTIRNGFPTNKSLLPSNIQQFWKMKDSLYEIDSVPFCDTKMLIPKSLRGRVLEGLHIAHQGPTGMLSNARQRFFWPGLDAAIRAYRGKCCQCNTNAPSQRSESPIQTPNPTLPFQQTVADLFQLQGHSFLVYADRYTGWLEVFKANSTDFTTIRKALLAWFSTFGVPEELASDGGPPFNSQAFTQFLKDWGINSRRSSAYYPQSNGRAEAAVKSAKRILEGNIDPRTGSLNTENASKALLSHRNTPNQDTGISPAMALYGHPLKDHLPMMRPIRQEWQETLDAREAALAKRHLRPSQTSNTSNELPPLLIGQAVQVQNQTGTKPNKWLSTGVIVETLPHRQYRIRIDGSRRLSLRNRKFLKPINPVCRKNNWALEQSPNPTSSVQSPEGTCMEKEPQPKSPQPMPVTPMVPSTQLMHSTGNSQAPPISVDFMPHTEGMVQNPVSSMVEPTTMPPDTAQSPLILQPPSTASTHELDAPKSPSTRQPAPEAKGSDRSNWRIPEGGPNSRPRRQNHQRLVYDAQTGLYRKPISKR